MIDWTKPIEAVREEDRAIVPARLLCTDYKNPSGYRVLTLITLQDGREMPVSFTPEGESMYGTYTIINSPVVPKHIRRLGDNRRRYVSIGRTTTSEVSARSNEMQHDWPVISCLIDPRTGEAYDFQNHGWENNLA